MSSRSRTISIPREEPPTKINNVMKLGPLDDVFDDISKFIKSMDKSPERIMEITKIYISIAGMLQTKGEQFYDLFEDFMGVLHSQEDSSFLLEQQKGGVAINMGLHAARLAKNKERRNKERAKRRKHAYEKKLDNDKINEEHAKKIQENTTQIGKYGLTLPPDQLTSYDKVALVEHQYLQQKARDEQKAKVEKAMLWEKNAPLREAAYLKQQNELHNEVLKMLSFAFLLLFILHRKTIISWFSPSKKSYLDESDINYGTQRVKTPPRPTISSDDYSPRSRTRRGTSYSVSKGSKEGSRNVKPTGKEMKGYDPLRRGGKSKKGRNQTRTQKIRRLMSIGR